MPLVSHFRDRMCESTVFLRENGDLSEVMQDVAKIDVQKDKVVCVGVLGDWKEIEGVGIVEANLMEHKIVLGNLK